jgi:hypothetical protein
VQCADVLDLLKRQTFSVAQNSQVQPPGDVPWNIWDWPMESVLDFANMLDATPLDFYFESET